MNSTARNTVIAAATLAAAGLTVTACGSTAVKPGPSVTVTQTTPAAAPAAATVPAGDATQVLTADGYTPVLTEPQTMIDSTFGVAAPYVSSVAAGTEGSDSKIEISVVISRQGVDAAGGSGVLITGLQNEMPGMTVTVVQRSSDDLIRVDGSLSAMSAAK